MLLLRQNWSNLLLASNTWFGDLLSMLVVSHIVFSYERFWKPCRQKDQSLSVSPSDPCSSNNCGSCTYLVLLLYFVLWTAGVRTRGPRLPTAEGHSDQNAQQNQELLHPPRQGSSPDWTPSCCTAPAGPAYPVPQLCLHSFQTASGVEPCYQKHNHENKGNKKEEKKPKHWGLEAGCQSNLRWSNLLLVFFLTSDSNFL